MFLSRLCIRCTPTTSTPIISTTSTVLVVVGGGGVKRKWRSEGTRYLSSTGTTTTIGGILPNNNDNNNNKSSSSVESTVTTTAITPPTTTTTATISAGIFKNPIVHELWTARQKAKQELLQANSKKTVVDDGRPSHRSLDNNTTTTAKDSYVQVSYPFSTDALLWETYRNPWGQMRLGKLFEDLDALAGNIAFFHVHSAASSQSQSVSNNSSDTTTAPTTTEQHQQQHDYPIIVTASVDRIRLRHRPAAGSDQQLSGQVTWTGNSSMEIRMQCCTTGSTASPPQTQQKEWLEAYVTFVTLDPHTKKPMRIPTLVPETEDEIQEFHAGAARAHARKQRRTMHSNTGTPSPVPPSQQSTDTKNYGGNSINIDAMAKQLMIEAGPLLTMPSLADPHAILLKDTVMQNAMIAQPQSSNLHNRVFGGFLIRRAFELAFANAYLFGGARPIFLEVDEISFASPVDVGDLLRFYSRILFTENNAGPLHEYYQQDGSIPQYHQQKDGDPDDETVALMHVEVEAWVTEPEKVSARMSNQFYFTFAVVTAGNKNNNNSRPQVRKVLPSNIDEARRMATRMHLEQQQKQIFR